ncbi:hypothetical protein [Psychrobacillus sp. FSL K6-2843]|uniref:hypothetical protein n=1 Tax=Psychrobacillus sp. FSL K6-2843 TaxID=2921549 RepID=UPI00315A1FD8
MSFIELLFSDSSKSFIFCASGKYIVVGVNWNAKLIGVEVEPSELLEELEEICGK